jgi:hypothetical protein
MAAVGDIITVPAGGRLPPAPRGTHWVEIIFVASDTGGFTEWQLNADTFEGFEDIKTAFDRGLTDLIRSTTAAGPGGIGRTRPLCFCNGTNVTTPLTFLADKDYVFVGATVPSGWLVVISVNNTTNVTTSGTPRVLDGVLLATTTTTQGAVGAVPRVPIVKGTTIYVWMGSTNGVLTIYLEDPSVV